MHLFAIVALVPAAIVTAVIVALELVTAAIDATIRWLIRRPPPR